MFTITILLFYDPKFLHSACGVQFCVKCHEEEGGHGHGECTECLPHTEFYHEENECLYGLLAEILEVAEEQEHEVEEEEAEKEEARIQRK